MFQARPHGFTGQSDEKGFSDYIVAGSFFGIIYTDGGVLKDQERSVIEKLKQNLLSSKINNLSDLESSVGSQILDLNLPAHTSFAMGLIRENVLYLKTTGQGQVYLRRGGKTELVISGDKSASGYVSSQDMIVFTTERVEEIIGKKDDIQAFLGSLNPYELIEKIKDEDYGDDIKNFSILFLEIDKSSPQKKSSIIEEMEPKINDPLESNYEDNNNLESQDLAENNSQSPKRVEREIKKPSWQIFLNKIRSLTRSRKFVIAVAVILFVILSWSVFFGYQRRQAALEKENIEKISSEIDSYLKDAEDNSYLNPDASLLSLKEAKSKLSSLKADYGEKHLAEIEEISAKIQSTEDSVLKKEEVQYEEFYDLALESASAKGDSIYSDGESLLMIDKKAKKLYLLDLSSKSLNQYSSPYLSEANFPMIYQDVVYFYNPGEGVMKFTSRSKVETVIEAGRNFGDVADSKIYNGNIYILDTDKNEVYKFLVTDNGFSDARNYLVSEADLSSAKSMAIDSAIYVSFDSSVYKFVSGVKEDFQTKFPFENVSLDLVYTDVGVSNVYLLDRKNSSIYIISKEGEYQKQLQSKIFKEAIGVYYYDDGLYVFSGNKIYKVEE